jgi:hypothetical protein
MINRKSENFLVNNHADSGNGKIQENRKKKIHTETDMKKIHTETDIKNQILKKTTRLLKFGKNFDLQPITGPQVKSLLTQELLYKNLVIFVVNCLR